MQPLLEMRSITETFPSVKALDAIDPRCGKAGFALVGGENGAGKSTHMKVLSGVYPPAASGPTGDPL